jgi:hypothetical protein
VSQSPSRDEERDLAWKDAEIRVADVSERAADRILSYTLIGLENAFRDADTSGAPYPKLAPSHPHAIVAAAIRRWLREDA